jgi:hypothetical protein
LTLFAYKICCAFFKLLVYSPHIQQAIIGGLLNGSMNFQARLDEFYVKIGAFFMFAISRGFGNLTEVSITSQFRSVVDLHVDQKLYAASAYVSACATVQLPLVLANLVCYYMYVCEVVVALLAHLDSCHGVADLRISWSAFRQRQRMCLRSLQLRSAMKLQWLRLGDLSCLQRQHACLQRYAG